MGSLRDTPFPSKSMEHTSDPNTQPLPGGNADDVDTQPLNDTTPVEDTFQTQVLDLYGETQVLDDPYCLETQVVDEFNHIDGEQTDKTEVLDDNDAHSDGESPTNGLNSSAESPAVQVSKELKPASAPRFTSIRAASFRASGLAARRNSLEGNAFESSSFLTGAQNSEEDAIQSNGLKACEGAVQVPDDGRSTEEVKQLKNGTSSKISCPTVRRLFDEECENKEYASISNKDVGDKEVLQLPTGDDGLSYIDSQEPGESSQANALACVQRLIEESKVMFDNEFDLGKSSKGKSSFISTVKGPQRLAKKTIDRGTNGKTGVFEWDDGREDEGGGDLFCRRKEDFLGSRNVGQRSPSEAQTVTCKKLEGYRDSRGNLNVPNEKVFHSDSKIVLHRLKLDDKTAPEPEINIRKNLASDFDERSDRTTSHGQLEDACAIKDMPEVPNVGLDTQIAAEAMEALFNGDGIPNSGGNDVLLINRESVKESGRRKGPKSSHLKGKPHGKDSDTGVATRSSRNRKSLRAKSSKEPSILHQKHSETARIGVDSDLVMTRSKRAKLDAEALLMRRTNMVDKLPSRAAERPSEPAILDEFGRCCGTALTGSCSSKKQKSLEELSTSTPVARQTRKAPVTSQVGMATDGSNGCGKETNCPVEVDVMKELRTGTNPEADKLLDVKGKSSELTLGKFAEIGNIKSKCTTMANGINLKRRSSRRLSIRLDEHSDSDAQTEQSKPVNFQNSVTTRKRSRTAKTVTVSDLRTKRITRSSSAICLCLPSLCQNLNGELSHGVEKSVPGGISHICSPSNGTEICCVQTDMREVKLVDRPTNTNSSPIPEHEARSDDLPKEATEQSKSKCISPVNITTLENAVSPVCTGDESLKQIKPSCKKNLSRSCLTREISSLCPISRDPISPPKDLRKRRELANVRVLFSHHLDYNVLKQQKKIVDRLKITTSSSIIDATHFIADEFVRTRNMLEAIASGKPVVTSLWLENVGRANYYVDEQKYILRDAKKEKEMGFNLIFSLAHARQHPLLEGRRVLITPKTKPGKEIISGLVKSVSGQALERVGRSLLKDDTIPDDLLILSCEEDYEVCVPFLEKGAAIYGSELLLNGIVTQKLEYKRHELFADHVKRTRSTIWLKKGGGDHFVPVTKHK